MAFAMKQAFHDEESTLLAKRRAAFASRPL
jgi:hypothetical protein